MIVDVRRKQSTKVEATGYLKPLPIIVLLPPDGQVARRLRIDATFNDHLSTANQCLVCH